uniref:Uncharacterized protein n=1 Tax=Anguilla anguilla TaxID=7936 RepID=A0A0E9TLN6_ANGAN
MMGSLSIAEFLLEISFTPSFSCQCLSVFVFPLEVPPFCCLQSNQIL